MWKFLRNLFKRDTIELPSDARLREIFDAVDVEDVEDVEDEEDEEEDPYVNIQSFITFMITKQGSIDLNISWNEDDDITATNLAILLHVLNSGGVEEHCANLLISIASQNPEHMNFVRKCIDEWNRRKKIEPLVKPSEVFQFGSVVPNEEEK